MTSTEGLQNHLHCCCITYSYVYEIGLQNKVQVVNKYIYVYTYMQLCILHAYVHVYYTMCHIHIYVYIICVYVCAYIQIKRWGEGKHVGGHGGQGSEP